MNGSTENAFSQAEKTEFDRRVAEVCQWGREHLSFDEAVMMFAVFKVANEELDEMLREATSDVEFSGKLLIDSNEAETKVSAHLEDALQAVEAILGTAPQMFNLGLKVSKVAASGRGKNAANARHAKPGGTRSKAEAVRIAWASGKYSSRDVCAEQECAALGMSFSSARKALRGTAPPA